MPHSAPGFPAENTKQATTAAARILEYRIITNYEARDFVFASFAKVYFISFSEKSSAALYYLSLAVVASQSIGQPARLLFRKTASTSNGVSIRGQTQVLDGIAFCVARDQEKIDVVNRLPSLFANTLSADGGPPGSIPCHEDKY